MNKKTKATKNNRKTKKGDYVNEKGNHSNCDIFSYYNNS